ncbi:hypothetical protein SAMD00019534_051470 [Acytostelium subglobosum LB1]|uniref:hypothetical protein n=1 Tax=Acytostelium subglobosum LB1 TaxID=1410327 RepID=UPI0006447F4F|nr:hypothetical protein SAMD00019534_051470 [Acytostelium subglobosum LB1]GAM21972.1 hypothetical protein SAMD00019534_051470 [Acytostelium subglobosum LB1]|eukprot:XP_012755072.1 hypothetical protein SAMD00019534_051470 [Acytostelium subglobosum LB1]
MEGEQSISAKDATAVGAYDKEVEKKVAKKIEKLEIKETKKAAAASTMTKDPNVVKKKKNKNKKDKKKKDKKKKLRIKGLAWKKEIQKALVECPEVVPLDRLRAAVIAQQLVKAEKIITKQFNKKIMNESNFYRLDEHGNVRRTIKAPPIPIQQ